MRPIENLRLDQWLRDQFREPFAGRIHVFAKIGMMNETFAADFQFRSKFAQVRFHHVAVGMHERIETENEIDGSIGNHRQRAPIIEVTLHARLSGETLATRFDAFIRAINGPQLLTIIFEIVRPSPEPGGNFQNRAGWQEIANARKNCARPLRSRTAPRLRPFLACLFPIVLHLLGMARTIAAMRLQSLFTRASDYILTRYVATSCLTSYCLRSVMISETYAAIPTFRN